MKRYLLFLSSILILLILLVGVYAEGITEGYSKRNMKNDSDRNITSSMNKSRIRAINGSCEFYNITKDRIKCRLAEGKEYRAHPDNIPEACRTLKNLQACIALYAKIQHCYALNETKKDKCFKKAIGFKKAKLSEEKEQRAEKAREYLVALLYDLQGRIETANEQGKISDDDSADLIEQIIAIKQAILDGKPKKDIQPLLHDFKQKYKEVFKKNE